VYSVVCLVHLPPSSSTNCTGAELAEVAVTLKYQSKAILDIITTNPQHKLKSFFLAALSVIALFLLDRSMIVGGHMFCLHHILLLLHISSLRHLSDVGT